MKRVALTGFIIWLVATIALRLGGQYIFGRVPPIPLLLITLPIMALVARAILWQFPTREQRALGAIALVSPGLLLDTISAIWFSLIFPNIHAGCSGYFGGWLLFCNVVVLLTAVLFRPRAAA